MSVFHCPMVCIAYTRKVGGRVRSKERGSSPDLVVFLSHVQIKPPDPGDENERGGERTVGTRLRFSPDNKHNSLKTELVTFINF